jgi:hypothetical protein
MKILVTESQYNRILREEKEQKIFRVPDMKFFHEDRWEAWDILQKVLEVRGNPPYTIDGGLDLRYTSIKYLGNLISVGGNLDLSFTPIESLGNLQSVGGFINLYQTPLSEKYTKEEIRQTVNVDGKIFL